jgi:ribonuclease-3
VTADNLSTSTGYQFKRKELLEQALTHRSYSRNLNNERLEFLGDSILNQVISNHIYLQFGDASEGDLSRIRASLVKQEPLRDSILADGLEALIAAIYLDSDYAQAETVILHLFRDLLQNVDADSNLKDAKTQLQEYLQARQQELPHYRVEQTSGQSHNQVFTVSCELVDIELQSRGKGSSRKKAEQQAAQNILDRLGL